MHILGKGQRRQTDVQAGTFCCVNSQPLEFWSGALTTGDTLVPLTLNGPIWAFGLDDITATVHDLVFNNIERK